MAEGVISMSVKATAAAYALDESTRESLNVAAFCRENDVSRAVFYKYVSRVREEGLVGLEERSRRPHSSPLATPVEVEDRIVRLRKELGEAGLDHGATTLQWHLASADELSGVPSVSTVHRVLVRRGQVVPSPHKRPKSSWQRFEASAPNEMWQIDHTDWEIATGPVKIFNIVDDHSRVAIRCRAVHKATTEQAWRTFSQGTQRWGLPAGTLSDNGLCFSGKLRQVEVFFEAQLRQAGVQPRTGRPFHPQTTGKVERFQQTLKKWLRKQSPALTIEDLQADLDEFERIYNTERPHQGIDRQFPIERWHATPALGPADQPIEHPDYSSKAITLTVQYNGCVRADNFIIHIGAEYQHQTATVMINQHHATVFVNDNLVRHLELDRTRRYQPSGRKRGRPQQHDLPS